MKVSGKKKISAVIACAAVLCVSVLSYGYSSSIDISENELQSISAQAENASSSALVCETAAIDDYELNIGEFTVMDLPARAKDEEPQIGAANNYGMFFVESKGGKVKKYKYGDCDPSEKYLIKGTADFSKLDVPFDGYFLVDETLTGRKKGQVVMYKGEFTFPNGDEFDGTVSSGKYYSSGTYTWSSGQSYKGKFTESNKLGTTSLPENKTEEYGYFYFDSSKKNYLFIRFVNSVPRETGYYVTNGKKYTVVFDSNGKCTHTSLKSR